MTPSFPAPATNEIPVQKGSRFGEAPSAFWSIYQGSTKAVCGSDHERRPLPRRSRLVAALC